MTHIISYWKRTMTHHFKLEKRPWHTSFFVCVLEKDHDTDNFILEKDYDNPHNYYIGKDHDTHHFLLEKDYDTSFYVEKGLWHTSISEKRTDKNEDEWTEKTDFKKTDFRVACGKTHNTRDMLTCSRLRRGNLSQLWNQSRQRGDFSLCIHHTPPCHPYAKHPPYTTVPSVCKACSRGSRVVEETHQKLGWRQDR